MKILYYIFFGVLLHTVVFAKSLTVVIKDVLDLATYNESYRSSFSYDPSVSNVFQFEVDSWVFHQPGYKIFVSGDLSPVDEETVNIIFKKDLYFNGIKTKTLSHESFLFDLRRNYFVNKDSYRNSSSDLIVRQENEFIFNP